jgi:hypothetical protein
VILATLQAMAEPKRPLREWAAAVAVMVVLSAILAAFFYFYRGVSF